MKCQHETCTRPTVARGYCDPHYRFFARYGAPVSPFGYGERRKHPLYEAWRWQARVKEGRVERWNDFWKFVEDVKARPSENHWQRRHDERRPFGPENFYWLEVVKGHADRAAYMRSLRARNPMRNKGYDLKKHYGITLEQYAAMYEAQEGKCAICGEHGEQFTPGNGGKSKTLVVDHDHSTGRLRKLLCAGCNKALGGFRDSTEVLQKAVAYLKQHAQ